ncbi:hypothetical protein FCULG_00004026 [Fusarium culmorum]|uniref:Uncharacterized protein n=1 Tax=Fusarium culmorum TaxID=5516 RepID=A0A2T4HAW7_FUSCU|nr:hypothetical protein FCULG_00004026 [Fusarium culmorum]
MRFESRDLYESHDLPEQFLLINIQPSQNFKSSRGCMLTSRPLVGRPPDRMLEVVPLNIVIGSAKFY